MKVFVKMLSGEKITLDVNPSDNVERIKQLVENATTIDASDQRLSFGSVVLDDSHRLSDYNISHESTIYLPNLPLIEVVLKFLELNTGITVENVRFPPAEKAQNTYPPYCTMCDAEPPVPALFGCKECNGLGLVMCADCKEAHLKPKFSRSHTIFELNKSVETSAEECSKHPGKTIEYCCKSCHTSACASCAIFDHAGHTMASLCEGAAEERAGIELSIAELQDLVTQKSVDVSKRTEKYNGGIVALKADLNAKTDRLIAAINQKRIIELAEIDLKVAGPLQCFESEKAWVRNMLSRTRCCSRVAQRLFSEGSAKEVFEMSPFVSQTISALSKRSPDDLGSHHPAEKCSAADKRIKVKLSLCDDSYGAMLALVETMFVLKEEQVSSSLVESVDSPIARFEGGVIGSRDACLKPTGLAFDLHPATGHTSAAIGAGQARLFVVNEGVERLNIFNANSGAVLNAEAAGITTAGWSHMNRARGLIFRQAAERLGQPAMLYVTQAWPARSVAHLPSPERWEEEEGASFRVLVFDTVTGAPVHLPFNVSSESETLPPPPVASSTSALISPPTVDTIADDIDDLDDLERYLQSLSSNDTETVRDVSGSGPAEVEFEFTGAFDGNGLLHYLGTQARTAPYRNPHDMGVVTAAASSIMSGNVSWFVGDSKKANYTQKEENAWMSVKLCVPNSSMVVRHYCLRNDDIGGGAPRSPLRNWELQGSNDGGATWAVIKRHENDGSIAVGSGTVAAWAIAEGDQRPYSSFRIFNFGVNAAGAHMLCCSGIELYGRYFPRGQRDEGNKNTSPDGGSGGGGGGGEGQPLLLPVASEYSGGVRFEFTGAFDGNGLLHYLGTQARTAPYRNPHDMGVVTAAASSIMSGNVSWFVGDSKKANYTQKEENAWMSVKLCVPNSSMVVRHYCLRNDDIGGGAPRSPLRNWELQGSNDGGATWTVIKRHENDGSIAVGSGTVAAWAIAEGDQRPYSSFRIFNFGVNAAGAHMLCCSGIELYGRYFPRGVIEAADFFYFLPALALLEPSPVQQGPALLFVTEYDRHRVAVVDAETGGRVRLVGLGEGAGPGQLNGPSGLAMRAALTPGGTNRPPHLFVSERGNHRVQVFNAITGEHIRFIGAGVRGAAVGQLDSPAGVAVFETTAVSGTAATVNAVSSSESSGGGSSGGVRDVGVGSARVCLVAVADCGNRRVQLFDADSGEHVCCVGITADEPGGRVNMPVDLLFQRGANGAVLLFVSDYGDHCVRVYVV